MMPPGPLAELRLPAYPGRALASGYGKATVFIRFTISAGGLVKTIEDSPLGTSTGGEFAEDFREAVREAVRDWEFHPATRRRLRDGADLDGDGKPDSRIVVSEEPISVFLDARFDFDIVDGQGVVRSGSGGAPPP